MTIRAPKAAAYASIYLQTYFQKSDSEFVPISRGTAFVYSHSNHSSLVTNWHVVCGRHPEKPSVTLPNIYTSPTHFSLQLSKTQPSAIFEKTPFIPLYEPDDRPKWRESPLGFEQVDLVSIECDYLQEYFAPPIQRFARPRNAKLEPGKDVCIIGYPFETTPENPFPIWKKAMIASEPSVPTNGRPYMYLDSAGRSGMSGSPVYFISPGFKLEPHLALTLHSSNPLEAFKDLDPTAFDDETAVLEFAGVYSGSYGDMALDQLNLGRFWGRNVVDQLFADGRAGRNPFPPI